MTPIWPVLQISRRAAERIEQGNLWIFSNEFPHKITGYAPGSLCHFACGSQMIAFGYINPHSLISGRVLSRGEVTDVSSLLYTALKKSFSRRLSMINQGCLRLVYSEADFLPGLVLDGYSGIVVLQSNTAGIDGLLAEFKKIIPEVYQAVFQKTLAGFLIKSDASVRQLEGLRDDQQLVLGKESDFAATHFSEGGVTYAANFIQGQKTGFFLDQKQNRMALGEFIQKQRYQSVLDLFCYSGGWGLRALASGAKEVTFVDQSAEALELVRRGAELNQISMDSVKTCESDVFDFLAAHKNQYDVVVADPPAFVKSKKALPQAKKAYEKLMRHSWQRVKPGGMLFACSCSYHLSDTDFWDILRQAIGYEKSQAEVAYIGKQSEDHPILLSMPETKYLKCIGLKKL